MLHALLAHLRRLYQAAALAAFVGSLSLVLASADGARMEEIARARYGEAVAAAVRDWRALIFDPTIDDERERLTRVNTFFNRRLRFDDDIKVWKEADYWATPLESIALGAGDCEDFAIAKYASLLISGISSERLRLIYVRARIGGPQSKVSQAHMVARLLPDARRRTAHPRQSGERDPSRQPPPRSVPDFQLHQRGALGTGREHQLRRPHCPPLALA